MGAFIKGDVVIVPFPSSDLSNSKKRPALVLANLEGDDLILAQITSQNVFDSYSINIELSDFSEGTLNKKSNIRPNKIFTADENTSRIRAICLNVACILKYQLISLQSLCYVIILLS